MTKARVINGEAVVLPARSIMGAEMLQHPDPINPAHYTGLSVEPIDVIEAWNLGFHLGNTVKYIARAGRKTADQLTDLRKSRWYLDRRISQLEKELKNEIR